MIKEGDKGYGDAIVVLGLGVRSNKQTDKIAKRFEAIGVECIACRKNIVGSDRSAIGCGLCDACYEEAGLENEHSDGYHEDESIAGCPACRDRVFMSDGFCTDMEGCTLVSPCSTCRNYRQRTWREAL